MKECFGRFGEVERSLCVGCGVVDYCESYVLGSCGEFGRGYDSKDVVCKVCVEFFEDVGRRCVEESKRGREGVKVVGEKKSGGKVMMQTILEWFREGIYSDEFKERYMKEFGKEARGAWDYVFWFERRKGLKFEKRREGSRVFYKVIE